MNQTSIIFVVFQILVLYTGLITIFYAYKLFSAPDFAKKNYRRRLIKNTIALCSIGILYLGLSMLAGSTMSTARNKPAIFYGGYPTNQMSTSMPSPYPQENDTTITDTREFLKKYFSANIQTRKVEAVAKKVELLIKESDGRIDSSRVGADNSYFSFVIPKSELEIFERDLRTYTQAKLYTQTISTANLLPEKQSLEQNQNTSEHALTLLTDQKKSLEATYTKQSDALRAQLLGKEAELRAKRVAIVQETDENEHEILLNQERSLIAQVETITTNLKQLESTFKSQLAELNVSIATQTKTLENLDGQESNFFDNIETVQGNVAITHISIWQLLVRLSPIHPIVLIAGILVLIRIFAISKNDTLIPEITRPY